MSQKKDALIQTWVSKETCAFIMRQAKTRGISVSGYLRMLIIEEKGKDMSKQLEVNVKKEEEFFKEMGGTREVYPFAFQFKFIAGSPAIEVEYRSCPVIFGVRHLVSNLHESGIAELTTLLCANVNAVFGDGIDLCSLPTGDDPILGYPVSFPWMSPANQFQLKVKYTGKIPVGVKAGEGFTVVVTLVGEARIVA